MRHGAAILGNFAKHGMVPKSLVRVSLSYTFAKKTNNMHSYQQVQHLSSIETAIRYLPNITAGSICNILTGLIVHRISVKYLVVAVSAICACAPLLMAVIDPTWPWWWCGFWVMLLLPTSVDGTLHSFYTLLDHVY